MRRYQYLAICAAMVSLASCRGADEKNKANAAAQAPASAAAPAPAESNGAGAASATGNTAAAAQPEGAATDPNRVETMQRTTSDGRTIETRELVGPDVQPHGSRPLRHDEVQEIEKATGRPYQEGDSIHGRAKEIPRK